MTGIFVDKKCIMYNLRYFCINRKCKKICVLYRNKTCNPTEMYNVSNTYSLPNKGSGPNIDSMLAYCEPRWAYNMVYVELRSFAHYLNLNIWAVQMGFLLLEVQIDLTNKSQLGLNVCAFLYCKRLSFIQYTFFFVLVGYVMQVFIDWYTRYIL